jgi:hypothetical protein
VQSVFFDLKETKRRGTALFVVPFFYTAAPSFSKRKKHTTHRNALSPSSLGPTLARARAPPAPKKIPPRRKK